MKPVEVRRELVQSLGLDLIGPDRDSELLNEVLPQAPSRWYLTGFLVPIDADEQQKADASAVEGVDELSDAGGTDDATTPEPAAARHAVFPSSMGLSLLVPTGAKELRVTVRWGDYTPVRAASVSEREGEAPLPDGAACHGCLLIAETSCEQHNDFLDRALVVPTVEDLGADFFKTE
jgi:hypothetical protein